jgi:hypothetical protein
VAELTRPPVHVSRRQRVLMKCDALQWRCVGEGMQCGLRGVPNNTAKDISSKQFKDILASHLIKPAKGN